MLVVLLAPNGHLAARVDAGCVRHDLRIAIEPATHRLTVVDRVTLPAMGSKPVEFLLNGCLAVTNATPPVDEVPAGDVAPFLGINAGGTPAGPAIKRYRLRTMPAAGTFRLEYSGPFDFGLSDQKEEYTRGFRDTAGIVSDQGVYLAGSGAWYPQFATDLVEFTMEVKAPAGWQVISGGSGVSRDADGIARWSSRGPVDEIYLVGGPLLVSRDRAGSVETLVYLHEQDDALAGRYLATAGQ